MPRARENPYLAWLEKGACPPFPGSITAYREAGAELLRRFRLSIQRFRHLTARPALVEYERAQQYFQDTGSLVRWGQVAEHNQHKPQMWNAAVNAIEEALFGLSAEFEQPALRKTLRHILCLKNLTARQRRLVRAGLLPQATVQAGLAGKRVQTLEAAHVARERARNSRPLNVEKLWVHPRAPLGDMVSADRRAAKAAAQKEGYEKGSLFVARSEEMTALRSHSPDARLRHAAWAAEAHGISSIEHIEQVRAARHEEATEYDYASTLAFAMSTTAVRSPHRLGRLMELGLESHRASARKVEQRQVARARRKTRTDVDPSWDRDFLNTIAPLKRSLDVSPDVFPWKETAVRALTEIVGIMGWRLVGPPTDLTGGVSLSLCFNLRNDRGDTAHIFYTPFNSEALKQNYAAAEATPIRLKGVAAGGSQVAWISQTLSPSCGGFTLAELGEFVHELGHVLHYFTLEGVMPREDDGIPGDTGELPAVLLQQYVLDPAVLMRWSSAPKARRRAYWSGRLALTAQDVLIAREQLIHAYIDFLAHRHTPHQLPYEELAHRAFAKGGMPLAPDGGRAQFEQAFVWRADYVARESTHVLAKALVHRLVVPRADGQTSASDIASAYRELCERVLSGGTDDARFRRLWRNWLGEGVAASMSRGMRAMARHHRRLVATS